MCPIVRQELRQHRENEGKHSGNKTPMIIITFHLIKLEETSDNDLLTKEVQSRAFLHRTPQEVVDLGEGEVRGSAGGSEQQPLPLLTAEKQGPKQGFPTSNQQP